MTIVFLGPGAPGSQIPGEGLQDLPGDPSKLWLRRSGTLPGEDLGTFGFPGFTDMDALPLSPVIARRFEAGCQRRTKIHAIVDPVHYRILLLAPAGFHDPRVWADP